MRSCSGSTVPVRQAVSAVPAGSVRTAPGSFSNGGSGTGTNGSAGGNGGNGGGGGVNQALVGGSGGQAWAAVRAGLAAPEAEALLA